MLDRHTIWVAGSILVPAGMALVIGVDKFIPGSIGPIFGGSDELLAGQEEKLRAVTHQVAAVRQSLQGIVAYHEGAVTMAQIGKIWVHAALMGGFLVYQQYQKDECVALRERVAWYAHRIAAISAPSTPRWGGEKKQEKKPTPFGGKLTPPLELSRRSNDSPRSTQSPRQAAAQGGETGWGDAFEAVKKRMDSLEELTTERISQVEGKMTAMDAKLSSMEGKLSSMRRDMVAELRRLREAAGLQLARVTA